MAITFDPNDPDTAQLRGIERQRAMANALTSRALSDRSGGQMAGRVYIPNAGLGTSLGDLATFYAGNKQAKEADEKEAAITTARGQRSASLLREANAIEAGSPGVAATPDQSAANGFETRDEFGNPVFTAGTPGQAAVKGDKLRAAQLLQSSSDPRLQKMGDERAKSTTLNEGQIQYGPNGEVQLRGGEKYRPPQTTDLGDRVRITHSDGRVEEIAKRAAPGTGEGRMFSQANDLRKGFEGQTKDHVAAVTNANNVYSAPPTAQGDIARVFSFMKMLDPGSTVREGEFATVGKAAGMPEKTIRWLSKVDRGEALTPAQRNEMNETVSAYLVDREKGYKTTEKQFTGIANQYGIPVEHVINNPYATLNKPKVPDVPPAATLSISNLLGFGKKPEQPAAGGFTIKPVN